MQVPPTEYSTAFVRGSDRYKFFRRPIIPFLQQIPPEVLLATARHDPLAGSEAPVERAPTPLTKTVEVQTDYRDSEAQTDPYTPEYVVRPGSAPELLTLATLSFGKRTLIDTCFWITLEKKCCNCLKILAIWFYLNVIEWQTALTRIGLLLFAQACLFKNLGSLWLLTIHIRVHIICWRTYLIIWIWVQKVQQLGVLI